MTKRLALFPLPQSVNFPGSILPLHIFEPRYRQMVEFCVKEGVWLGVSHTKRVIKETAFGVGTLSDQNAYESHPIFSAGPVTVLEKFEDGRLLIEVQFQSRFNLESKLQTIPFEIVDASEFFDDEGQPEFQDFFKQQLETTLERLLKENGIAAQALFSSSEWKVMNLSQMSFQFLNFVKFEADVAQTLLEEKSPELRVQSILKLLGVEYYD